MRIVKLGATESTNTYLKQLAFKSRLENFTVVTADHQSEGRGQRGAAWESESGKNLIASVLIEDVLPDVQHIFALNIAVALSVLETLKHDGIAEVSVKWPNDIMAGNKKVGGILIENVIKSLNSIQSIVGIGLNVNQSEFVDLPKASSLKNQTGKEFDATRLLISIVENLKRNIARVTENDASLWQEYNANLFCRGSDMPFQTPDGQKFYGKLLHVNNNGLLEVETQAGIVSFDVKDVQLLY